MTNYFILSVFTAFMFAANANDECTNATELFPNPTCTNTNGTFNGMTMSGAAPLCGTASLQDVWYKFTATSATMSVTLTANNGLNHGFELIQGGCNGTVIQCVNANSSGYGEHYFNNNFVPGQQYYVRVFNAAASMSAANFGICVRNYPNPSNDACSNAGTLTPNTTCNYTYGTFSGALLDGGTSVCGPNTSQDIWYKFTASDSTMSITLSAEAGLNNGFELIQGGCNGTVIQCVNANSSGYGEHYFNNNFIPGQEYYIRAFNASGSLSTTTFGICLRKYPSPANDDCATATTLTPNTTCSYVYGTFSGAMMGGGTTPSCATNTSQDVWYKFTATDSTMSITLSAEAGLNHGFELIQGGCNGTVIQCINANTSTGYGEHYFNNNFIPGQEYYIRVFNASGSLNTITFGICLRKYPSPANDDCATATTLTPTTTCGYVYGTFSGAMMGGGTTPSCATNTSQDVWYKFTATDSTMSITLSAEAGLNHGFELIQGGCNGTVIQCINANTSTGYGEHYFNNNFIPGQEYYIRVFNASGSLNTITFGICLRKYPSPGNDNCATATTLTPTTTCNYVYGTFSGAMMGGGTTPSCATNTSQDVWYKFTATDSTMSIYLSAEAGLNHGFELIQGGCNGTVLQCINANTSTGYGEYYFNNNFIPGQEYYIRVFNASGSLNTITFGICLQKYPSPANDNCATATTLTPTTTCGYVYGTFSGAMMGGGTTPSCATNTSQDVWYKFTATDPTMSIYLTAESGLNHGFELIQGGCNGTVVQCVNVNSSNSGEYYFNNTFIPGQEYYIRVFNASGNLNTATFGICLQKYPSPANDLCANAAELTPNNTCGLVYGTFSGALMDGGTPSCAASSSQDVWYKFTATATSMSVQLGGTSGLNHGFQVFQGSCNGTEVICRNQNGSGSGESASLTLLTIGQTYFIRVFNASSNLSTITFNICLIGPPPSACTPSVVISTSTTTICQGESITFTAAPTNGGTAPAYQWKVNGGNVGSNSASYTSNTLTNGSIVTCVMTTNAACASSTTATSNQVTMTVTPQATPAFTQLPAICSGESLTLPETSNNGISGTWSPAANNTVTTTYTFTPYAGQCAATATMTVTVSQTTPVFTQIPAICPGGSFTLPETSNNGISGTWNPAINNMATTTYTFTPNTGQCASTTTMTVTVSQETPAFSQIPAVCSGTSFTLPAMSNNGISGTWSPAIDNTATTTYTFTPNTGQCATTATMTVTVTTPVTPVFTQIPAICSGSSFTLPTTSSNGISGTWSPAINNTATTTYTFTPNAGQCATTVTMTVTVNNGTTTPVFTQVPAICSGSSFSLPTTSSNGIIGTWSPAINNTATTTYTFTPNAGQCATTTTMTVTVNENTTPVFTPVSAICSGESLTLPSISNNGISGTWSPAANNTTTTTYTFTPTSGQCVQTVTMTIVVNAVNTTVTTQGNTITAVATGASYQWIDCNDEAPVNGAIHASFTPSESGSYAVIVTQNGCTDTSTCIQIGSVGIGTLSNEVVQLYPNPFEQEFTVNSGSAFIGTLFTITDVYGNVIRTGIISEEQQRFSMREAAAGVYFILVDKHIIKFIKQH